MRQHRLAAHDPRQKPWQEHAYDLGALGAALIFLVGVGLVLLILTGSLYAVWKPLIDVERAAQIAGQAAEESKAYRLAVEKRLTELQAKDDKIRRLEGEKQALTDEIEASRRAHAAEIRAAKKTEK